MTKHFSKGCHRLALAAPMVLAVVALGQNAQIGREVAIPSHLADGEEFNISVPQLIRFGEQLFNAKFTVQEGAGRPRSKGTGAPISDSSSPFVFPRNFDRLSSPEPILARDVTMRRPRAAEATASRRSSFWPNASTPDLRPQRRHYPARRTG